MYFLKKKNHTSTIFCAAAGVSASGGFRLIFVPHYFARTLSSRFVTRSREKLLASTANSNPATDTLPKSHAGEQNPEIRLLSQFVLMADERGHAAG